VKERIKIALLLNNPEISLWEFRVFEKLQSSDFAEIKLIIKKEHNTKSIKIEKRSLMYRFHQNLDKHLFRNEFDYNQKTDISSLSKNIPVISYRLSDTELGDNNNAEIVQKINSFKIDVILNFGDAEYGNDLLSVSRNGVWSYAIGDERIIRGTPWVYWAIVEKAGEIGSMVIMSKTDIKNKTVIYRTSIQTFTKSINVNKNRIYGLASLIIPRLINGLFVSGETYIEKSSAKFNRYIEIFVRKPYTHPNSLKALSNLILILMSHFFRNLVYKKEVFWDLYFRIRENQNIFTVDLANLRKLSASKYKFWADPFVISRNNNHFIFVEEYLFGIKKAHISVLKLDNEGTLLSNDKIIEKPYHLSYPFVFELDKTYYMIPESKEDRNIQLYRCMSFPEKWEFVMNIMENIFATDTTLFFYKNKWWLFTAIDELKNPSVPFSELFLYYSDDLFSGIWQSHPMNPIISDIKTSRPAGKIFILDNKLYRPSQDCSGSYGKALNLNLITKLSEREYEEIPFLKVEPGWKKEIVGTHTFNFNNNIFVIDASPLKKRFGFNLLKS